MFDSFFPKAKWFFISFAVWALLCVIGWYTLVSDLDHHLVLDTGLALNFQLLIPLDQNNVQPMMPL
ncbi:hypothetical protein [Vibrio sonorensis]|uniref:hypothetical protein n=1 Tax=Vibrio sonorensis TaxID=1004316 RepID=UPI001C3117ED|nr:hypothetical protein [Vibrio sonorensis]